MALFAKENKYVPITRNLSNNFFGLIRFECLAKDRLDSRQNLERDKLAFGRKRDSSSGNNDGSMLKFVLHKGEVRVDHETPAW
jgi:hypothetical protein